MRPLPIALGAIMVVVGAIWTFQGYIGGSPMSDQAVWAILGPLLAGLGVGPMVTLLLHHGMSVNLHLPMLINHGKCRLVDIPWWNITGTTTE